MWVQGASRFGVWWVHSWPIDVHLLPVSSQSKERAMSLLILKRMSVPSWGPTLMASSNPNNIPKAPPPNSVSLGVKPLCSELLGNKHRAITAKTLSKTVMGVHPSKAPLCCASHTVLLGPAGTAVSGVKVWPVLSSTQPFSKLSPRGHLKGSFSVSGIILAKLS